jgi:hypothetical protein
MSRLFMNVSLMSYEFLTRWITLPPVINGARIWLRSGDPGGGADSCGSGAGSAGVFQPVLNALLPLARNAWAFGVGILIVVAGLGGLYFILQGTAGAATGGSGLTGRAIIGMVGIIVMVLMAFLLLPQLSCMLQKSAPSAPF